jgi:hypothetical protein
LGAYTRLAVIAANFLGAGLAFGYGRSHLDLLPEKTIFLLENDHFWLGVATFFFGVNFFVAWRFRNRFSVSAVRMLAWAVVAYLSISQLVDLVGMNWGEISNILSLCSDQEEIPHIVGLRARIAAVVVLVSMALTAITIGFESETSDSE